MRRRAGSCATWPSSWQALKWAQRGLPAALRVLRELAWQVTMDSGLLYFDFQDGESSPCSEPGRRRQPESLNHDEEAEKAFKLFPFYWVAFNRECGEGPTLLLSPSISSFPLSFSFTPSPSLYLLPLPPPSISLPLATQSNSKSVSRPVHFCWWWVLNSYSSSERGRSIILPLHDGASTLSRESVFLELRISRK